MRIVKVPGINCFGKNNGSRNAGSAVLKELRNIWSSEKGKPVDADLLDVEEIHVDNSNLKEQEKLICENSGEEFENQERVIFLGGDHSISYPIGRAFLENCRKSRKAPCLIVFDAHPDCMPRKDASHEEWLRALIEGGFPAGNVMLVGARNSAREEIEFLGKNRIRQVSINQIIESIEDMSEIIMEFASGKELYVSFDIDVIDPAFAASTGYKEPGGLTSRQALYIISRIGLMKNLRAFDLVEIDSENDKDGMTVKLGAKLLAELL